MSAVRKAIVSGDESEKFDWSKTWLAEMLLSGEENVKRAAVIQGLTPPEVQRRNEIKAGVITASVGFGLMIFLFVLMNGIIAGGRVSEAAVEILSRIWVAGVIPVFVGAALIINGVFVNKLTANQADAGTKEINPEQQPADFLPPAETKRIVSGVPFSVTDETTRHLEEPIPVSTKTAELD